MNNLGHKSKPHFKTEGSCLSEGQVKELSLVFARLGTYLPVDVKGARQ